MSPYIFVATVTPYRSNATLAIEKDGEPHMSF